MGIATTSGSNKCPWLAVFATVVLFLTVPPAQAAEIVPVKGEILANSGTGYHPIGERTTLSEGDAVIAAPESQGSLVYADGCTVDVVPGMIAWVGPKSPCSEGAAKAPSPSPLVPAKTFKRDWLVGGAAMMKRTMIPAGP